MRVLAIVGAIGVAVAAPAHIAHAQPAAPAAPGTSADELHQRGRELARAWRQDHDPAKLEEAARLFKSALALGDSPLIECDLGLALHYLGEDSRAHARLTRCMPRLAAVSPDQVAGYRGVEDEIAAAVAVGHVAVDIATSPPGTIVTLSSFPPDETMLAPTLVWLRPGTHRFTARIDGHLDATWTIEITEGEVASHARRRHRQTLTPTPVTEPTDGDGGGGGGNVDDADVPAGLRPVADRPARSRTPAYATLAVGGVLLVGGGVTHYLSQSKRDHLATLAEPAYGDYLPTWQAYQRATVGLYAAGAIATGVGAWLYLRAGAPAPLAVSPTPEGRGAMLWGVVAVADARAARDGAAGLMSELGPTPDPDAPEWYCASCERSYTTGTSFCPEDGTRLVRVTDGDPLLGRTIDDRFVIRDRLGQGGMGVVYRAWQASVGREVAIKVIRPRPGQDAATAKRFLREAKLSSQLSQPSTVGVIDFGQADDGILYLVMELLRGRTLAEVLRDHGRMSPERAVRIAIQMCDALEAAHRLGIIHRDLKPANVMMLDDPPGRDLIKVLDFGLAKVIDADESTVTQSGRLVGTPSHLPPEVALGEAATHRSDLYAIGVMLFEMLDGRPPFAADNVNMMVALHAYQPAPELGPHVPRALAQVVARTLAKRPEARPASAAELRTSLEAALRGEAPAPASGAPIAVTADSDAQRRLQTRTTGNRSPDALAETLRKPKTRPPLGPEAAAAVAALHVGASVTAEASESAARAPVAAAPTVLPAVASAPRRRWPLIVGGVLALGAAVALAVTVLGGGGGGGGSGSGGATTPALAADAAAATAVAVEPIDAAPADATAAPVEAAAPPVDAGAPIDAGRRRSGHDEHRPPRDAGTGSAVVVPPPPPPKKIDAGPCHPWEDC